MKPCVVFASQAAFMPLARLSPPLPLSGDPQVEPPSADEMEPMPSWHVLVVHAALGSASARMFAATMCWSTGETTTLASQVAPPLVERVERIDVTLAFANGTITVPSGCTTG